MVDQGCNMSSNNPNVRIQFDSSGNKSYLIHEKIVNESIYNAFLKLVGNKPSEFKKIEKDTAFTAVGFSGILEVGNRVWLVVGNGSIISVNVYHCDCTNNCTCFQ